MRRSRRAATRQPAYDVCPDCGHSRHLGGTAEVRYAVCSNENCWAPDELLSPEATSALARIDRANAEQAYERRHRQLFGQR